MSAALRQHGLVWGALGLALGLVIAAYWPAAPLHAVATAQQENFAICTGPVDNESEAIFFLDPLTGDLKAAVLSPQTGTFLTVYEHNVLADLGVDTTKNPQYLMVTGINNFRRTTGAVQLGTTVCYVADTSGGKVAAYGLPWSKSRSTDTRPIKANLMLLDRYQFRAVAIRQQ